MVLLIQIFITSITSSDPELTRPKVFGTILGILFFYALVALLDSKEFIKYGIFIFLGGGLILSIVGILDVQWTYVLFFKKFMNTASEIIPKISWKLPGAWYGINLNALGGILILVFPLSIQIPFSYLKRKKENHLIANKSLALIFSLLILSVMSIVLFLTQSIGSWLGIFISTWILLLSWKWKKWSSIIILILVLYIILLNANIAEIILNEVEIDISFRKPWWSMAIDTINNHPLFGIGMNQFRQLPSIHYYDAHAHNHFLHTAAELGIPGLIAYFAILIGTGFMCIETWRKSKISWIRLAAQGLGCGQLAHLFFGIADSIPLGTKPGIFFWFSLGLITSIYNLTIKEHFNSNSEIKYTKL